MRTHQSSSVRQYLSKVVKALKSSHLPDADLLDRYVRQRDEAAFAALVQRYGPLVLGVCERVLPDKNEAEDAFQATFLVLVHKADTLDRRRPVSHWLYTIAYRTAMKARIRAARRLAHEHYEPVMAATPAPEAEWEEVRPILDEELNRLPEKYRTLLVLCYLEGMTQQQAASALGCPVGSVSRHIISARKLLRQRLIRRGVVLSASLLLAFLGGQTRAAGVTPALVASTTRAALDFAQGSSSTRAGQAAPRAALLAAEVLASLAVARRITGALWVAVLVLAGIFCATAAGMMNPKLVPAGGSSWVGQASGQPTAEQAAAAHRKYLDGPSCSLP